MRAMLIHGTIDRLLQVNYRITPAVAAARLGGGLRPYLVGGAAIGGLALVRLGDVRPWFLPQLFGTCSENLLHWIAVESDGGVGTRVLRRDSDGRLGIFSGGRSCAGEHHPASFEIDEGPTRIVARAISDDGCTFLEMVAGCHTRLPAESVFGSPQEAARLFDVGSAIALEGVSRRASDYEVLRVGTLRSHVFENRSWFPAGSVTLDSAILMRGLRRSWSRRRQVVAETGAVLMEAHA